MKIRVSGPPPEIEAKDLYLVLATYAVYSSPGRRLALAELERRVDELAEKILPKVRLKPAHALQDGSSLKQYILQGTMSLVTYVEAVLPPIVELDRGKSECFIRGDAEWFYDNDLKLRFWSIVDLLPKAGSKDQAR